MFEITDKIYLGSAKPDNSAEWGNIEGTLSNQTDLNTALSNKQATLVSGTNIKTINGVSVLGEGDIEIGEGGTITVNQSYDATSTYAQSGTAVAEAVLTKANTSLNNLSSDGQMIVDSANGTISNCILDIPQNIKLTLENNVLTLKAGSVITLCGSTYATVTTTSDYSYTFGSGSYGKRLVVFPSSVGNITGPVNIVNVLSGSTLPETGSVYFNTTDKLIYTHASGEWLVWNKNYPVCVVDCDSEGNVTFAKDSNGNDMIFNGAGFIGHHAFVYPNVKALVPDGLNADGSMKNAELNNNALRIVEMATTTPAAGYEKVLQMGETGVYSSNNYKEVESYNNLGTQNYSIQYVKKDNVIYYYNSVTYETRVIIKILSYAYNGTTVTDFTIRQPVRMATTEMLDKKQDILTFDTTPTSASTNPVTSGGVYTALSGKQADITTITGYDATKTQTLKNVSGVLTWVDDGE